ncbi:MAG TPA: flagellar biosynthesis protein FliQ [Acidobacteriota bacterium]|nr:flagellar biosynthesis protein FliQ [Acidobacteriota bacterium]
MSQELVMAVATEAIRVLLLVAAPMLIAGLVVGVLISIFQTATSIQDQTLTFIPKIITVLIVLLIALPWMMQIMTDFTARLFSQLHLYVR